MVLLSGVRLKRIVNKFLAKDWGMKISSLNRKFLISGFFISGLYVATSYVGELELDVVGVVDERLDPVRLVRLVDHDARVTYQQRPHGPDKLLVVFLYLEMCTWQYYNMYTCRTGIGAEHYVHLKGASLKEVCMIFLSNYFKYVNKIWYFHVKQNEIIT